MGGHRAALVVKRPSGDQIFVNDTSLAEFYLGRVADAGYQPGMVEDRADVVAAALAAQCDLGAINGGPSHCLGTALCRARGKLPRGAWQALRRLNRAANDAKHCWPEPEAVRAEQYYDGGDDSLEAEQPDRRELAAPGRWADFSPGCTGSEADCKCPNTNTLGVVVGGANSNSKDKEKDEEELAPQQAAQAAAEEAAASKAAEEEAARCAAVSWLAAAAEEVADEQAAQAAAEEERKEQEEEAAAKKATVEEVACAAAVERVKEAAASVAAVEEAARRAAAAQCAGEEKPEGPPPAPLFVSVHGDIDLTPQGDLVPWELGDRVKLVGLARRTDLNGSTGTVVDVGSSTRVGVETDFGGELVKVKVVNLARPIFGPRRVASGPSGAGRARGGDG